MLTKEILEEFKLECELRRLTPRTIKGYYNSSLQFLTWMEKQQDIIELEEIRTTHIKMYMQYLIKKNLSPSYINSVLRCIRAYFRYAVEEDYLRLNPAEKINWQRQGKVLINTFTDEEVRALLNVFDFSTYLSARNKLVLAIAFDTGARNSEIQIGFIFVNGYRRILNQSENIFLLSFLLGFFLKESFVIVVALKLLNKPCQNAAMTLQKY